MISRASEAFIAHYASKYYDPVKAREYYLRTRELKGRQKGLETTEQKEAWGYAKTQISEAKKQELQTASETAKAQREQLYNTANTKRQEIAEKFKDLAVENTVSILTYVLKNL